MVTIQVSADKQFRQDVALALVTEDNPGYHGQGFYYADPVNGIVYYKETNSLWDPWPEDAFIVDTRRLVDTTINYDFSDAVDWEEVDDLPWRDMIAAYLNAEGEEFEANGDIPEWVTRSEVIAFAVEHSEEWQQLIQEQEILATELAISFAEGEILDQIEID